MASEPQIAFTSETLEQLEMPLRIGDQIDLGVRVGNQAGAAPCDISDLTIRVHLPAPHGGTGEGITLIEDVTVSAGIPAQDLEATIPYTVDLAEGVFQAPIALSWSAIIHQDGDENEAMGAGATARVTVTRPAAALKVAPDRTSGEPPLTVTYKYALTNTSPVGGSALDAPLLLSGSDTDSTKVLSDANCDPIAFSSLTVGVPGGTIGDVIPDLPGLFPGLTWNFTCTTTLNLPGTYSSQPSVDGISSADGRAWPAVAVEGAPVTVIGADLIVAKSHQGDLLADRTGQYRLRVTNRGNRPTAGEVRLADQLPKDLTATALSGQGWNCNLGSLNCRRSDSLGSGLSYPDVTLKVKVAAKPPNHVVNTASVSGGGEPEVAVSNNSASDPTRIRTPGQPKPTSLDGMSSGFRIRQVMPRRNGTTVIRVLVPRAGRVVADDAGKPDLLSRATRRTATAGTYALVVKARKNLRRQLKRSKGTRKIRVRITFRARKGSTRSTVRAIPFNLRSG